MRDKFIKTNSLMEFENIEDQVNAVGSKQTREKSDIVVDLGESVGTELTELIPQNAANISIEKESMSFDPKHP